MDLDLSLTHLIGLGAGALMVAVGFFILAVRPQTLLHRLFFLFALADGASTILFRLSRMAQDAAVATYFRSVYWYFFIAFVVLIFIFGLRFPRPLWDARVSLWLVVAVLCLGAFVTGIYIVDHDAFFRIWVAGGVPASSAEPLGNVVHAAWMAAMAFIVLKLTHNVLTDASSSHRRQAAYVMGGMTLAYTPYATINAIRAFQEAGVAPWVASRPDQMLVWWVILALGAAVAASAALLALDRRPDRRPERRLLLGSYAALLVLTVAAGLVGQTAFGELLRMSALLAFPILLGYAIARYGVFDIDEKIRRAATVSLATILLSAIFVVVQFLLGTLLEVTLLEAVPSRWIGGSVAALVAAAGSVPAIRMVQHATGRLIPELSPDKLHRRKLEIYRHSLAGILEDGIIEPEESRALGALRESLGLSLKEHRRLFGEIAQAMGIRPSTASAPASG